MGPEAQSKIEISISVLRRPETSRALGWMGIAENVSG